MIPFLFTSTYAATVHVFSHGRSEVTVPASSKIAVFTHGTAKVFQRVGYPQLPNTWLLLQTVTNREYISAAFSVATLVRVEPDAEGAWYNTGTSPTVQFAGPGVQMEYQPAPTADT